MAKLKAFVRLDFVTIKPYFTAKNLLIFAGIALFITFTAGTLQSAVQVGMMLGTMFVSYPFAVGEKSNMDALYATLSVSRKTVVLGRYIFALALNICAVLFSLVLASASMLAARVAGNSPATAETLWATLALSFVFIVVQVIQLPIFFKLGYAKAKFFSIVPLAMLLAGFIAFNGIAKNSDLYSRMSERLAAMPGNGAVMVVIAGLSMCLVVVVSYRLSLLFYRKREF